MTTSTNTQKATLSPLCQVAHPLAYPLPSCSHRDSGYYCENPEPGHGDQHWTSEHTIRHVSYGDGYACEAV
ncbi:hypothetical protein [Streptomyces sp. NPDC052042]|uniref:hypothetical protein n=1 Tax=Streptomyces sp. NPDC052042 TaxID=3365683 RepID=UPI0037D82CDF